jgi:hypothetical protein
MSKPHEIEKGVIFLSVVDEKTEIRIGPTAQSRDADIKQGSLIVLDGLQAQQHKDHHLLSGTLVEQVDPAQHLYESLDTVFLPIPPSLFDEALDLLSRIKVAIDGNSDIRELSEQLNSLVKYAQVSEIHTLR